MKWRQKQEHSIFLWGCEISFWILIWAISGRHMRCGKTELRILFLKLCGLAVEANGKNPENKLLGKNGNYIYKRCYLWVLKNQFMCMALNRYFLLMSCDCDILAAFIPPKLMLQERKESLREMVLKKKLKTKEPQVWKAVVPSWLSGDYKHLFCCTLCTAMETPNMSVMETFLTSLNKYRRI